MKKLTTLIIFVFITQGLMAQEFTITPLEEGLDFSSLDSNIKVKPVNEFKNKKYLSPKKRDEILFRTLGDKIKELDEADRDILYKSIIYYSEEKVLSKYPFLKSININKLKQDLKKDK